MKIQYHNTLRDYCRNKKLRFVV